MTGLNEEVKLQLKPKRPREATHVKGVIVGGGGTPDGGNGRSGALEVMDLSCPGVASPFEDEC